MRLDQFHGGSGVAGLTVGASDRLDLAALARRRDALSATVGRAPDATNHAVDLVLIPNGVAQPLKQQNAGALAHDESVGSSVKRR